MRQISTLEATRYEIEARAADGRAFLVSYAAGSPSRRQLVRVITARGPAIVSKLGLPEDARMFDGPTKLKVKVNEWTIGYSGRTQREVRSNGGELPFIGG